MHRILFALFGLLLFCGGMACGQPDPAGELPFENPIQPQDETEAHILSVLEAMRAGRQHYNVSVQDGRMLRLLTESTNAQRVVEIGTSTGESAIWFALALRETGGHLYTHEINEERAQVARENFRKAGVDSLITLIEGDAHETVQRYEEPIDILFLDADMARHHDEKALDDRSGRNVPCRRSHGFRESAAGRFRLLRFAEVLVWNLEVGPTYCGDE